MTPEGVAQQKVRERGSAWLMRLFRNNSGVLPNPDTFRPVRFGLGNESKEINKELKSSDLIGGTPIIITPEMVGKTVCIFTTIEAKPEGFVEKKSYPKKSREYGQKNWIDLFKSLGAIAGFASCPEDVDKIMAEFNKRFR